MKKLWLSLMASTVLSGLAGLAAAQAASDVALPKADGAGPAATLLAQAAPPPEDDARRKQRQERQERRQERRQEGQQPQQQQQQQQQRRQDRPAASPPPPPPPQSSSPPPPPAAQPSSPPPPPSGAQDQQRQRQQDRRQERQERRQDRQQDRSTTPASPPPPPAATPGSPPPPPPATTTTPRSDQTRDRDRRRQGRDRDGPDQTTTPSGGTTPGAQDGAPTDRRSAPLTRSGNPPAADAKPIQPAGRGKGAAVQSSGGQEIRNVNQLRNERREEKQGNRTVIREPDRTIIKEGNRTIIRHDESVRFRLGARDVRVERAGNDTRTIIVRPGGERIITVTDRNGFLLRRVRVLPNGREIVIIDNRPRAGIVIGNLFVSLGPPRIRIPRERYIVVYRDAPPVLIYETLTAPPVDVVERAYTLDEIRYNEPLRARMPRIDLNTVNFETGSWELAPDQIEKLAPIADAMKRAIEQNPQAVFMIEGYTDRVGDEEDNLSLSDRRAESVAVALTDEFQVPPENLVTQGYGEEHPIEDTDGPSEANRRVSVRNVAPLLAGRSDQPQPR